MSEIKMIAPAVPNVPWQEKPAGLKGAPIWRYTQNPIIGRNPVEGVAVEAVPAYNISEGHLDFHPKSREDCGYIVTIGGSRIYIAGDTENNEDVKSVKSIDVAFLPVNQMFCPYHME